MNDRIKDALDDIKSAIDYAYYQGFTDLRYDPVNILVKEIERLTSLIPQPVLEDDKCTCKYEEVYPGYSKVLNVGRWKTDPNCPQHGKKCTCKYPEPYNPVSQSMGIACTPDWNCPIHGGLMMILRNGNQI